MTLIPWLLRWDYLQLDDDLRKTFEVALHAGAGAALLVSLREDISTVVRGISPGLAALITLSAVPPAAFGYVFERPIERRLSTPTTIVAGLIGGGVAMVWADRSPQLRGTGDAGVADALWLGIAQACALIPGVSRGGATRAAARFRRFTRADSARLSQHVALPVLGGATLLKAIRMRSREVPPGVAGPLALGAGASFASALGAARLMRRGKGDGSLAPYGLYRIALGTLVIRRLSTRAATIGR